MAVPPLSCEVTNRPAHAMVRAAGQIDPETAPLLRAAIETAFTYAQPILVFDLTAVTCFDTAATLELIRANDHARTVGVHLIVIANAIAHRVLTAADIPRITLIEEAAADPTG